MKKILIILLLLILGLYIILCGVMYLYQEKLLFFPEKLDKNYVFNFDQKFEELSIRTNDGILLHGLLFKAKSTKGLIFYLHGNAGSLSSWGNVAETYTDLNYDVFILDYRGYGKSEGTINGEKQMFEDNQIAYDYLMKQYNEEDIIVLGYSVGSGLAAKLASVNNPSQLILQAPYYSLIDMMKQKFSFIPTFLLKYRFRTNEYLRDCEIPITIFHGDHDKVIYYGSSLKLKNDYQNKINMITLFGHGHNGITDNKEYKMEIKKLLFE